MLQILEWGTTLTNTNEIHDEILGKNSQKFLLCFG
jgi:hypothetical protein